MICANNHMRSVNDWSSRNSATKAPQEGNSLRFPKFLRRGLFCTLALGISLLSTTAIGLPSVTIGHPALIAPAAAESYYPTSQDGTWTSTYGATPPTPYEINELARALGNNVDEIYDFVRNYVDTVFIFGAQKGALGAIVDKSGTPFDQAQLMVALLRQAAINNPASNYTASYKFGTITLTGPQFTSWTNVADARAACDLLASGGIPASINGSTASMLCTSIPVGTVISSVTLSHVWVDVVLPGGSTHYQFDPSYKIYNFTNAVNLNAAAGLTTGQSMTAATTTGYSTGSTSSQGSTFNYVKGLNATCLNAQLHNYAANLQNYIQTQSSAGTPAVGQSSAIPAVPLVSGKIIDLVGGSRNSTLRGAGGGAPPDRVALYIERHAHVDGQRQRSYVGNSRSIPHDHDREFNQGRK